VDQYRTVAPSIEIWPDKVIAFHKSTKRAAATLVLSSRDGKRRQFFYGSMDIDEHGRICRFLQDPGADRPRGIDPKLDVFGVQPSRTHRFSTIWAGRLMCGEQVQATTQGKLDRVSKAC